MYFRRIQKFIESLSKKYLKEFIVYNHGDLSSKPKVEFYQGLNNQTVNNLKNMAYKSINKPNKFLKSNF